MIRVLLTNYPILSYSVSISYKIKYAPNFSAQLGTGNLPFLLHSYYITQFSLFIYYQSELELLDV